MANLDVLVLGDYFCDFVITGLREVPRLGADLYGERLEICPGGAFIFTAALTRLGARAAWIADLGTDLLSRFILEEARREGLDESLFRLHDFPLRRLSVSFSFATDRGFISSVDPIPECSPMDVIKSHRPAWVINLPFEGRVADLALIQETRDLGCRVFMDCQYVDYTLDRPGIIEALRLTDVFAPNESEALQLTGAATAEEALDTLAQFTPLVIIKRGPKGAIAQEGKKTYCVPAIPVQVVDTTGAGDCFNAGFLAARIAGQPIEMCLQWGNICGGLSTTRHGGVTAAPTLAELKEHLARLNYTHS